jgi:hypothetical protein
MMGTPTGDSARDIRIASGLLPASAGVALLTALATPGGLTVTLVAVPTPDVLFHNMAAFSSVRTCRVGIVANSYPPPHLGVVVERPSSRCHHTGHLTSLQLHSSLPGCGARCTREREGVH